MEVYEIYVHRYPTPSKLVQFILYVLSSGFYLFFFIFFRWMVSLNKCTLPHTAYEIYESLQNLQGVK